MEYAIAFDDLGNLALGVGLGCTLLSFLMFLFMLAMRVSAKRSAKRHDKVFSAWQPVLLDCLENPHSLTSQLTPKLRSSDLPEFLLFVNYLHESLRGKATENLNSISSSLKLTIKTKQLLKRGNLPERLLAITTLGNLSSKESWKALEKITTHRDPIFSFWAVRALFRIDPEIAGKNFLRLIAKRQDWSPSFVASMFRDLGSDQISESLGELALESFHDNLPEKQVARLISYLSLANPRTTVFIVRQIIYEATQPEILIACLRLFPPADDVRIVRELIQHENWAVRMHAAVALGKIGGEEDSKHLIRALSDLEWWVRYRAACALFSMPYHSKEKLNELSETLHNPFARDIVRHVNAEIELKCQSKPSSISLFR